MKSQSFRPSSVVLLGIAGLGGLVCGGIVDYDFYYWLTKSDEDLYMLEAPALGISMLLYPIVGGCLGILGMGKLLNKADKEWEQTQNKD